MQRRSFSPGLLVCLFVPCFLFGQQHFQATLKGRVVEADSLNNGIVNVLVQIKNEESKEVAFAYTDDKGYYLINVKSYKNPPTKPFIISTEANEYESFTMKGLVLHSGENEDLDKIRLKKLGAGGEFTRVIAGYQQSGASASNREGRFFYDLYISVPFKIPFVRPWGVDEDFGPALRAWGYARITSVPQQIKSSVREFAGNFGKEITDVKVNEIAQAAEFLWGFEHRLSKFGSLRASFDGKTQQNFSLSFVLGFGAITPLEPRETLQIFRTSADTERLYPQAKGKDFIAFVSPDRNRFFRQYYLGFRLETRYFDANGNPLNRFPAMLDFTFGQNEAVTKGCLCGSIFRFEGFYPLAWENLKFIYLFGTAHLKFNKSEIQEPLILQPAPTDTPIPAVNAAIVTIPQINRDYYRIGVGIDFFALRGLWK